MRYVLAIVLVVVAVVGLLIGTCGVLLLYETMHVDAGPTHAVTLAGNAPITDAEALDVSKQVLILDNKWSSVLHPSEFSNGAGGNSAVIRHPESSEVLVFWYDPIPGQLLTVHLQRKDGQVIGRVQKGN